MTRIEMERELKKIAVGDFVEFFSPITVKSVDRVKRLASEQHDFLFGDGWGGDKMHGTVGATISAVLQGFGFTHYGYHNYPITMKKVDR